MNSGVFPHPPVQIEGQEGNRLNNQNGWQIMQDTVQIAATDYVIHPQIKSDKGADGKYRGISSHQAQAVHVQSHANSPAFVCEVTDE